MCGLSAPTLPQSSSFDLATLLEPYTPHFRGVDTAKLLNEFENLFAFFVALRECKTITQASAVLFLYFKTHVQVSVIDSLMEYVQDFLELREQEAHIQRNLTAGEILANFDDDDESLCEQSGALPSWLLALQSCKDNWKLLVQNKAFSKISKLISMSASLGLCNLADFNFDLNGVRMFSIPTFKKHVSATDIVSAALDTVTYFIEGGYRCFTTKSLMPFVYSDAEAHEFDTLYFEIVDLSALVKAGNLEKHANISENDFDYKLEFLTTKATALYQSCEGTWEKKVLFDRLTVLRKIRMDFTAIRVTGKLREAPFGVYIYGPSGVGKSSINDIIMRVVLQANGFDASDDRIVTINEADKFMSNFKSYLNGVVIDDIGNTLPDFVERSPCQKVLEMINNVPIYANMAEADQKGKVAIEPKCVTMTSNARLHALASMYSIEKYSIVRRAALHFEIAVKPQFCIAGDRRLDSSKVLAFYNGEIPSIPDLWDIDICVPCENTTNNLTTLKAKASIFEVIEVCTVRSREHFANQQAVVTMSADLDQKLNYCHKCHFPGVMCKCPPPPKVVETPVDGIKEELTMLKDTLLECIPELEPRPDYDSDDEDMPELKDRISDDDDDELDDQAGLDTRPYIVELCEKLQAYESPFLSWTNWVPDYVFENRAFDTYLAVTKQEKIIEKVSDEDKQLFHFFFIFLIIVSVICPRFLIAGIVLFLYLGAGTIMKAKKAILNEIRDTNGAMPTVFKQIRDNHAASLARYCAIFGIVYVMIRIFQGMRRMTAQGNLMPCTQQEIDERDGEENPWSTPVVNEMPVAEQIKTTTHDDLCNRVYRNLCAMEIPGEDSVRFCDALFLKSNVALIPKHMWKTSEMKARFVKYSPHQNGATFEAMLSSKYAVDIPGTDLTLTWVPNGGSWKNITHFLPSQILSSCPATMVYKDRLGNRISSKCYLDRAQVDTGVANFPGYKYTLQDMNTFNGLCMATWISNGKHAHIAGFHLGGVANKPKGAAGVLTVDQFETAMAQLSKMNGVILSPNSGTVQKEQYGKKFFETATIHPKSPLNFLPEGNNVEYYGTVSGSSASLHSDVVPSLITKEVEEVCGVPQKWGKPKFHRWKNWQASLEYSCKPSCGIEGNLLTAAVADYIKPLLALINKFPSWKQEIRPLTKMQTVCGIDGKRFIDKMPPNTSVGYPLGGPKKNFLTALDPLEHPDFACPMELDEIFWEAAEEMKEKYRADERAYPVFKACAKDEPTLLTKEKVRIFQSAPIAFQLLIRMFFLPIVRFLSMNPLTSECAVGINSQGPEWDELAKHLRQFGLERILAGDYSKYDLRMPAQLIFAAFSVLIAIAEESGNYTEDDLKIMRGIATDISYPMTAYNGDYIQLTGSNPSGQNLTVYINSIVNSLLFRCAYFEICKDRENLLPFQEVCALGTYGDDAKGSVAEGYDEFNHIAVADFLAARDMVFTMPDKTSDPTPFMTDVDADLLKRKNIYHEELGLILGALDEESIFKSLHSGLKSKSLSKTELAMNAVDGALREWFPHGRDVYESRRSEMIEVANKAGIAYGCRELAITYDERIAKYRERYDL